MNQLLIGLVSLTLGGTFGALFYPINLLAKKLSKTKLKHFAHPIDFLFIITAGGAHFAIMYLLTAGRFLIIPTIILISSAILTYFIIKRALKNLKLRADKGLPH